MAPSKITDRTSLAVIPTSTPPVRASRLPTYLRLPILLVLNLGISSALWTYAAQFLGNELGVVSRQTIPDDILTPTVRLLYKIGVIWAGWWLKYDCKTPLEALYSSLY